MPDSRPDGTRQAPSPPLPDGQAVGRDEPTVGTGSIFAIGCTIATLLIIFVGIAIFVLLRVL